MRILYQPVSNDSVNQHATIIRASTDRAAVMVSFCQDRYGDNLVDQSFLDIGAGYGYFLDEFNKHCATIKGIENGENQKLVTKIFYPEIAGYVDNSDLTEVIDSYPQYDIVSMLSVMHIFIIEHGTEYATDLLQKIDAKTRDVLFFEMAQDGEVYYGGDMDGWTPEVISHWITQSTTFNVCEPLMQDGDEGFGRTLFACYRTSIS